MRPRWALSTAAIGIALTTLTASPAMAVADEGSGNILLSNDGVSWGPSLTDPLFPSGTRIVPGDSLDADFWVKNNSDTNAWVSLRMNGLEVSFPQYALTMAVALDGATSGRAFIEGGQCYTLVPARYMTPGQALHIDTSLSFDAINSSLSQNKTAQLVFTVQLTEAVVAVRTPADCPVAPGVTPGGAAGGPTIPPSPGATTGTDTAQVGGEVTTEVFGQNTREGAEQDAAAAAPTTAGPHPRDPVICGGRIGAGLADQCERLIAQGEGIGRTPLYPNSGTFGAWWALLFGFVAVGALLTYLQRELRTRDRTIVWEH
ncbi:hypothetical protein GCM10009808_16650 [Microbacterium sediminicola]|uniref:SDR-like Ig domain-containing protein n=1 Tax=Microbacterium sediminicola TaxID=415210 RepID=A0ABN2I7W1_9MICO